MYKWYRKSAVCYAFLEDVEPPSRRRVNRDQFKSSRWFTRGWTLQELLAPLDLRFYSHGWSLLGDRTALADLVTQATGIERRFLLYTADHASAAKKMSWAAHRNTSRIEDIAYCLMGLFGVNMPLLYGEGNKAFVRLQQEIARTTGDHSIFAWGKPFKLEPFLHPPPKPRQTIRPGIPASPIKWDRETMRRREEEAARIPIADPERTFGLFAESPRDFEHCGNIDPLFGLEGMGTPPVVFGKNVRIGLPVVPGNFSARDVQRIPWLRGVTVALLGCEVDGDYVALLLRPEAERYYMRSRNPILVPVTDKTDDWRNLQSCVRTLVIKDFETIEVLPLK